LHLGIDVKGKRTTSRTSGRTCCSAIDRSGIAFRPGRVRARELLSQRIRQAEVAAGLPKLVDGTCHPYRGKWRTERSHHPIKAVAVARGWSDFDTMLKCYDHPHPDDADLLAVTSEPKKRHYTGLARMRS
jgi:hypothetical protein